ncbi:hypothetical protein ACIRTB_20440 [Streptomyces sp. NPDC101158]|uniref:hypothetical protein n=1 Tax=Streptomyces sp. NPDC101158 TaxID=3366117 RepID=UPI0037F19C9A
MDRGPDRALGTLPPARTAPTSVRSSSRQNIVLGTVCPAALAITPDTTIVNVALPELSRQLDASTRDLQWTVDAQDLAFASLVLTTRAVGDRASADARPSWQTSRASP